MTSRKTNSQSGFAIGLILLAVVLIAAIVAAIAVSTQDSGASGDREQARINASTLVQQGIALQNAVTRYDVLGLNSGTGAIIAETVEDSDVSGPGGTIDAAPDPSTVFNPDTGDGIWTFAVDGSNVWVYVDGVPADANEICQQINSILWNSPVAGDAAFVPGTPAAVAIDGTARTEGCSAADGDQQAIYFKRVLS